MTFNPIIPVDAHPMLETFVSKHPLDLFDESDIKIDFDHFLVPNHAAIHNEISNIGKNCFPLAFTNKIVLVETPSGYPSVYRLEDIDVGDLIQK
jgi:hypothetical protein